MHVAEKFDLTEFICSYQFVFQKNFPHCDHGSDVLVHDFAQSLLQNMPENAIIFTKGDLPTNTMRYVHHIF